VFLVSVTLWWVIEMKGCIPGSLRRIAVFFCLLSLVLLGGMAEGMAAPKETVKWILKTRKALASGNLLKMETYLQRAEKSLEKERKGFKNHELDNISLWLHLFRSRFHQLRGLLPAIKPFSAYQNVQELKWTCTQLDTALIHLQKAATHLRRYNILFKRVMRRLDLKSSIALVNTVARESMLKNRVQIVHVWNLLLKGWIRDWKKPSKKQALDKNAFERFRKEQKKEQQKFILWARARLQDKASYQAEVLAQLKLSKRLTWAGIIVAITGAAVGIAGIICHFQADAWDVPDVSYKFSPSEARALKNWGTGLLIGGSLVAVTGSTIAIVGRLWTVTNRRYYEAIYKKHQKNINLDEKTKTTHLFHPNRKVPFSSVSRVVVLFSNQ